MQTSKNIIRILMAFLASLALLLSLSANATPVVLQNASATAEQSGWGIASTIDGSTNPNANGNGWAFCLNSGCGNAAQAGVWQTTSPLSASSLTIDLYFGCTGCGLGHKFQNMQFSYTTSANPTATNGATWNILTPSVATATLATLSISGTHVLATGNETNGDLYSITFNGLSLSAVTGFKMDVLLGPNNLIGFSDASNGNAVLAEFKVTKNADAVAVPEPASLALAGLGLAGLALRRRRLI